MLYGGIQWWGEVYGVYSVGVRFMGVYNGGVRFMGVYSGGVRFFLTNFLLYGSY